MTERTAESVQVERSMSKRRGLGWTTWATSACASSSSRPAGGKSRLTPASWLDLESLDPARQIAVAPLVDGIGIIAAMQPNASHLRGNPAISNLEQGCTPLTQVGQPIMIAVIYQFSALFCREFKGQTLGHGCSPCPARGSSVPLRIPD